MNRVLLLLISPLFAFASAQLSPADSLRQLLQKDKEDTNKVMHLIQVVRHYEIAGDFENGIKYGNSALQLASRLNWKKGMAMAYGSIGNLYLGQGDYPKTLDYYLKALKIDEDLNDGIGMTKRLCNIGIVYRNLGDHEKALDYYQKALKTAEETGNKTMIATALSHMGNLYFAKGNYIRAKEYYLSSLKIKEEIGIPSELAITLNNIGNVCIALVEDSIAGPEKHDSLLRSALDHFLRALAIDSATGRKSGIAIRLGNIGSVYMLQQKYAEAEKYLFDALALARELGAISLERQFEEFISEVYQRTKRYQLSLEHYKRAMALKDSLFNESKNEEITRKEMSYEFEKKEAAAKAEQDKKDTVTRLIIYSVSAGFGLVLLLAVFIYRSYRQKQKANEIISAQKELVEEKQKDILDSIHYAKRIQQSLLPTDSYIQKNMDRLRKVK
ncbi:MAG: tetratricopeptide repeat protein [Bacteroidota bacterium]